MNHAFRSLINRPLESLLLFLTLTFGVALFSLVLTVSLPGLKDNSFAPGLSSHELTVQSRDNDQSAFYSTPNAPPVVRAGQVGDVPVKITLNDLSDLKSQASAIQMAYVSDNSYIGDFEKNIQMLAITSEYLSALKPKLIQGGLFNTVDYKDRRPVALLTSYGAQFLFPAKTAVGQTIEGYRVIGVIELPEDEKRNFRSAEQVEFGPLGFIPYASQASLGIQTYQAPLTTLRFLPFVGREAEATEQLSNALQRRWGEKITLGSNAQINRLYREAAIRSALMLALMGLGGLLVASLSVMSLVLARVIARRRQLGISAALGATRANLRAQILLEVLLLATLGSCTGAGLTVGLLLWLNRGIESQYVDILTPKPLILLGTAICAILISIIFGLLPAIQASRTRPAEALRV